MTRTILECDLMLFERRVGQISTSYDRTLYQSAIEQEVLSRYTPIFRTVAARIQPRASVYKAPPIELSQHRVMGFSTVHELLNTLRSRGWATQLYEPIVEPEPIHRAWQLRRGALLSVLLAVAIALVVIGAQVPSGGSKLVLSAVLLAVLTPAALNLLFGRKPSIPRQRITVG